MKSLPLPMGSWISIEVSEKAYRLPSHPFISNSIKLNNNEVYSARYVPDGKDIILKNQPLEDLSGFKTPGGNFRCLVNDQSCVEGFYRNLKVDFGTCDGTGLNELLIDSIIYQSYTFRTFGGQRRD